MRDSPSSDALQNQSQDAARFLKQLANERRLSVLCLLAGEGEVSVGALAGRVGLSQSALSQHLARLRDANLVATRKTAQTVYYRIADPRVGRLLQVLREIYG
jgi:ArsR family transcriptional regulator